MNALNMTEKPDGIPAISGGIIRVSLRGAGQVMFQGNAWSGFLILCGIFWGAYAEGRGLVAWGALVGLAVSTVTGLLLPLPKKEGEQGLWGFNGILVGCAFMTFLGSTVCSWAALILCAALTTWVRTGFNKVMSHWKVNSLTMPFVFCTWLFLLAARAMKGLPPEYMPHPQLPSDLFSASLPLRFGDLVVYWLKGISQVFLIDSWVAGALFLSALLVSSRRAAFWAATASAISLSVITACGGNGSDIAEGLYGFSPVLTGIALGATFYKPSGKSALWCVLGIVVTVFVQASMNVFLAPLGLPALTGPFCVTAWLFLLPLFKFDTGSKADEDLSDWNSRKNIESEKTAVKAT